MGGGGCSLWGIAGGRSAIRVLDLALNEVLDIHERGLLLEHLRREVVQIGSRGTEMEEQAVDVGAEIEVILLGGSGALDGEVERAEFSELHLLAFEQLLKQTALQLVGNTQADVLTIYGVVFGHVLTDFLVAHGLRGDHSTVPLAEGCGFRVLVLFDFYEYRHNIS